MGNRRAYRRTEYDYATRDISRGYRTRRNHESAASIYYYGSEAPAWDYDYDPYEDTRVNTGRRQKTANRKRTAKAARMNPALIVILLGMSVVMCAALIHYVNLRYELTYTVNKVASLESELTQLRENNEETLNEINSSVKLEDIRYKAITQLGMTYANKDQIVDYENDTDDYVHQVSEVDN
jgi:cell division protein FtsL